MEEEEEEDEEERGRERMSRDCTGPPALARRSVSASFFSPSFCSAPSLPLGKVKGEDKE